MEALIGAISDIPSDEVKVDVVHKSVGIITESDVLLAAASNAVIIGFNINMNANASLVAKKMELKYEFIMLFMMQLMK